MERTAKTRFAHLAPNDKHAFITPDELKEVDGLKAKFAALESQLESLTADGLTEVYRRARVNFLGSPTEENKEALVIAFFKKKLLREDTTIRSIVREAQREFHQKFFSPWAGQIFERALKLAQGKLQDVTAEERQRIRERTGREMTHSDIVAVAQSTVDELKGILDKVNRPGNSALTIDPDKVLEWFGVAHKENRRPRARKYIRASTPRTVTPPSRPTAPKQVRRGDSRTRRLDDKKPRRPDRLPKAGAA